ncbi:hypothetical protein O0I10_001253 [Lichtheimia ornata]|uniref:Cyclin-like domain-containing protein n=1 Tax=Lichtheimia ornata TaxID=688661 RepID=A0AAD8DI11_9FUNG|nr:uncharacterized protein O0I10_001253 [Lichtheimia ornata]KAJ8663076.1 hypothetical protein O0I10_001253 [Lichtheimia ornata]
MQLRLEAVQPYTLFPLNKPTSFVSNPSRQQCMFPPPPPPPPSLQQHHHHRHHHQQQQPSYSIAKQQQRHRHPSAFEPVLATPSPPPVKVDTISQVADYAASIVYLMWHGRKKTMTTTNNHTAHYRQHYTVDATKPSAAFKKFCLQLLTATQLSQNAVYLALNYVCALLRTSPNIEGAEGSEYRLFTVALMLANKFLDDSTFTNKTWSEVSGMKLHDLNTMEAEFLEVIGYGLFVCQDEFDQWKHAVEGCRIHVERMSMDGYQYYLDNLIQAVLLSLGLSGQQPKQQQQRHAPPPPQSSTTTTTFEDDNKRRYKDALEQQERAIWEAALEASRLQVENRQRQHNLYLYAKAHALDTWGPPETPTLPRRQTAPPPPISRQGSNCSNNSSTSLLPPPLSSTPDRRASFASSMMLPTTTATSAAEYFHAPIDTARKVDFFQAPEHLDTRASKYEYHYPPPGLVDPSYNWNHSHPVSWSSYPLPETPAVTPSWCKDFL